jgi:hypothetical protein
MKPTVVDDSERCRGIQAMPEKTVPRQRAVSKKTVSKVPAPTLQTDEIARRAYEIFLARGGEPGRDLDDWLQAERELSTRRVRRMAL